MVPSRHTRRLSALAIVLGVLVMLVPANARAELSPQTYGVSSLCSAPAPGHAACFGLKLVKRATLAAAASRPLGAARRTASRSASHSAPTVTNPTPDVGSFSPLQIQSAYSLPATPTSPQTIAIVDAYDDPTAAADLAVYDHQFFKDKAEFPSGPPPCQLSEGVVGDPVGGPSVDGCFLKVNQNGGTGSFPLPNAGWAGEIATDIEIAHGICRSCRILLVEANSNQNKELNIAENTAAVLGANEISDSWGGPEAAGASIPSKERAAFEHRQVVITVASGDNGYLDWNSEEPGERGHANFPASSPNVVAVGGTRLKLTLGGARQKETVWNGQGASGGGCSEVFGAQSWQQGAAGWSTVGCPSNHRAVADVAAVGDPYTGIAVYNSQESEFGETGWATIGGTSVASPIIASVFALAGGAGGVAYPAQTLYENQAGAPASIYDVLEGSNGQCNEPFNTEFGPELGASGCEASVEAEQCLGTAICLARSGYDGPSGVGAPLGISAFLPTGAPSEVEPEPEPEPKGSTKAKGTAGEASTGPLPVPANPLVGVASPFVTPPTPTSTATPHLSRLALTVGAVAALNRRRPKASRVAFSFTLNIAARVHVSLAKRVKVHGRSRWRTLPGSITLAAHAGHDQARLKSSRTLTAGRYRLTSAPEHGNTQSIVIAIG